MVLVVGEATTPRHLLQIVGGAAVTLAPPQVQRAAGVLPVPA